MGDRGGKDLFPLPTSESSLSRILTRLDQQSLGWVQAMCVALNSLWGGDLQFCGEVGPVGIACLRRLEKEVLTASGDDWHLGRFFLAGILFYA